MIIIGIVKTKTVCGPINLGEHRQPILIIPAARLAIPKLPIDAVLTATLSFAATSAPVQMLRRARVTKIFNNRKSIGR
jgi:hypothetical protein